jgi:GntR family transcriptional regulator/MocR family aminotransferase
VAELGRHLPGYAVSGVAAGLHLVVHLPPDAHTPAILREAESRGLHVVDMDRYRGGPGPPALVLGYGNITDAHLPEAVSVLAEVIDSPRERLIADGGVPAEDTPRAIED